MSKDVIETDNALEQHDIEAQQQEESEPAQKLPDPAVVAFEALCGELNSRQLVITASHDIVVLLQNRGKRNENFESKK